jgi:hypothetical protein
MKNDARGILAPCEHLGRGEPKTRMSDIGCDFNKGDEDEEAFVQPRVRKGQNVRIPHLLPIKEEVHVQYPRAVPDLPNPSERFLHVEAALKESLGRAVRLDFHHPIQEPALGWSADRFGLVK